MTLTAHRSKILNSLLVVAFLCFAATAGFAQGPSPPTSSADRYLKILAAIGDRRFETAITDSKTLIIDDPSFPLVYEKLVNVAQGEGDLEPTRVFFAAQLGNNDRAHFALGLIARERGDTAEAVEEYKRCLRTFPEFVPAYAALVDTARPLNRLAEIEPFVQTLKQGAASRYGLSYLRLAQARYEEAIALSNETLRIDPHLSEAYRTREQSLYSLGYYAEAHQAAETLLNEVTEPEKIELRISGLIMKGVTSAVIGNNTEAVADLISAYQSAVAIGSLPLEENIHNQLMFVYNLQNDCAQSLYHAQAALALGNELKSRYVPRYLDEVGAAYACLGHVTEALSYYQQALEVSANAPVLDKSNLVSVLTNIASHAQGNGSKGLPLLKRALIVAQSIQNKVMEFRVRFGLGALYQRNGNHVEALEQTKAALKIAQEKGVAVQEGNSWNQLGRIYLSMSDAPRAVDAHHRALAIGERTQAPQVVWEALAGLAAVSENKGELGQAAQHYRQAVETIEGVRSRIGIAEDRASFLAGKIEVYKRLIAVLIKLQPGDEHQQAAADAFRYSERGRARAFLDELAEAKVNLEQHVESDLLKRQQQLEQRISQLNAELIKERSLESTKQNQTKIADLEKGLGVADAESDNWLRELRRQNPRYAALRYPEPIDLAETQRMLDDKTVLLSYSLAEPESFLFAISRNDFQVKRLPSETMLNRGVQKLLAAITDKNNPAPEQYLREAALLSRQLLQPAGQMLAGKKALVIVPDGALHRLPFEVLFEPGTAAHGDLRRLPYLIRRFAISYAPSASVLAELQNEPRETAPKSFIAFGDPIYDARAEAVNASTLRATGAGGRVSFQPLPYSRTEIDGIAQLFAKDDRELFFGEAATEENVKTPGRLSRYRLVHFSAHGYVNEARPRFSGLILSLNSPQSAIQNPQSEDGVLSAYEIFNLKLKADLVVLSACDTGLGKEVKGEGLMSLARAFMYAGSSSVVVSLWNVNDETAADLMIRFYRHLQSGMNKSEALRQAQLETIRDNGFPFFWAPFVLIGKS